MKHILMGFALLIMASCVAAPSPMLQPVCPAIVGYSQGDLAKAAKEMDKLKKPSVIADKMIPDYLGLRDQIRAACAPKAEASRQ